MVTWPPEPRAGGLTGSHQGRVGDSPLPGCGLYADDAVGAVSLSGDGESLIRTTPAARLIHSLETVPPGPAIDLALARLAEVGGEAGLIVIDADGRLDWGHNSPQFAVAHARSGQPARALHRTGARRARRPFMTAASHKEGPLITIGGHEDKDGDRVILKAVAERLKGGRLVLATIASHAPRAISRPISRAFAALGVTDLVELYVESNT